jgi:aldehyde:ferredoxin oxidoreductase
MERDRFGYIGKILKINLENEKIETETPDESYYNLGHS